MKALQFLLRPVILVGSLLAASVLFTAPETASAQSACYLCESDNGTSGHCYDAWPSGYLFCEETVDGCELSGDDCSEKTEDIQDALDIEADEILMFADENGFQRPHAPVAPGLYVAWSCDGEVVSVKFLLDEGTLVALPTEPWVRTHSLPDLAARRSDL